MPFPYIEYIATQLHFSYFFGLVVQKSQNKPNLSLGLHADFASITEIEIRQLELTCSPHVLYQPHSTLLPGRLTIIK